MVNTVSENKENVWLYQNAGQLNHSLINSGLLNWIGRIRTFNPVFGSAEGSNLSSGTKPCHRSTNRGSTLLTKGTWLTLYLGYPIYGQQVGGRQFPHPRCRASFLNDTNLTCPFREKRFEEYLPSSGLALLFFGSAEGSNLSLCSTDFRFPQMAGRISSN